MECRDSLKLTSLDHEFRKHCIKSETRVIVEWLYRENTENTAENRTRCNTRYYRVQVSCECAFANLH